MRITTIREFRDKATGLFRSKDPILVTRRGKLAGVFFPLQQSFLPVDMKDALFSMLTTEIARQVKRKGVTETEVLADFNEWRKDRRAPRRRR